jgi:D-amino-acid dehydrogenase
MRIAVLGAGVIGVTTAWYLADAGHEVTVFDRQPAAGQETSFANGGQISVSHAEPWAGPHVPRQLMAWLGHEASPLLWRLRVDPDQWRWGLRFLAQCTAHRARQNTASLVRLGLYSRTRLQLLRQQLSLDYDQLERGILHVFTSERELARVGAQNATYQALGYERQLKTSAECLTIEPALRESVVPLVGGLFAPDDESGDACKFTMLLAQNCVTKGVVFRYGWHVNTLRGEGSAISGVEMSNGEIHRADAYVLATGSYTPQLLKPLGVYVPIYPAKGYSLTIPLAEDDLAPTVSITDDAHKIVASRLGNRLRVAGTAEFNGYDTALNTQRCAAIAKRINELFPRLSKIDQATAWTGLRPSTPGNVPLIGAVTPYRNLYLNSGHGTLGWTLACGSGKLLADLVSARPAEIDAAPYQ